MTKAESTMAWCYGCGTHTRHYATEELLLCQSCLEYRTRPVDRGRGNICEWLESAPYDARDWMRKSITFGRFLEYERARISRALNQVIAVGYKKTIAQDYIVIVNFLRWRSKPSCWKATDNP